MQYNNVGVIAFLLKLHNKTYTRELVQIAAENVNTRSGAMFL